MKILVTLGGTEEPLDGVRCLSNRSTGSTGRAIAAHFASRGAQVTLLHAERVQVGDLAFERLGLLLVAAGGYDRGGEQQEHQDGDRNAPLP